MKSVTIKNFTKKFGTKVAVDDLSFEVPSGEIMAFLGGNGSGKTTTIRSLLGIYTPTEGELLIEGKPYSTDMNRFIGYLPEERGVYTKLTIKTLLNYFSKLRGFDHTESKKFIDEYLAKVDLAEHADKKIEDISSGMQQKVQIAIAILHKPELLILDEPFNGLDAVNRQLFTDIFRDLNKKNGTTILYSTHIVDEAERMADKVVIIKNGKRVEYGAIDEVRSRNGSDTIKIEFTGQLAEDDNSKKLFKARITNKYAELNPNENVGRDEVLRYLLDTNIGLSKFEIDRPSLNQIFIDLQTNK